MINWIDINLPWSSDEDYCATLPEFDHLSVRDRATQTLGCWHDYYNDLYGDGKINLNFLDDERIAAAEGLEIDLVERFDIWVGDWMSEHPEQFPLWAEHQRRLANYNAYWNWLEVQSEYLDYEKSVEKIKDEYRSPSFCGQRLNRPGTYIELENGKRYLIGDINSYRDTDGSFHEFDGNMIVRKYAVVFSPDGGE